MRREEQLSYNPGALSSPALKGDYTITRLPPETNDHVNLHRIRRETESHERVAKEFELGQSGRLPGRV